MEEVYPRGNFIHIDDVSNATYKVMQKGKSGEVYHVSTDDIISIRQLVKMICVKMNYNYDKLVKNLPRKIGQR